MLFPTPSESLSLPLVVAFLIPFYILLYFRDSKTDGEMAYANDVDYNMYLYILMTRSNPGLTETLQYHCIIQVRQFSSRFQ